MGVGDDSLLAVVGASGKQQGAAVLVGPHWQNFGDAYDALIRHKGAIVVRSAEEIAEAVVRLLNDREELSGMRGRASTALGAISGALPRTVEALLSQLPSEEGLLRAS